MLGARSFLLYSNKIDSNTLLGRYYNIIQSVLARFAEGEMDTTIRTIYQNFSGEPSGNNIIDDLIRYMEFNIDGKSYRLGQYIEFRLSEFSVEEQKKLLFDAELSACHDRMSSHPSECLGLLMLTAVRSLLIKDTVYTHNT